MSAEPESSPQAEMETLRTVVIERLTAAVDDILGVFVTTVARYREQIDRQRRQLDRLRSEKWNQSADVQQLLVSQEKVSSEQQDWSPSLDQENPPELPHIKEEQEDLWTSQEGEQLQGLEEADITELTFSPASVKSEDDDEEKDLRPATRDKTSHSSEPETEDSWDWNEKPKEPQSGLDRRQNNKVHVSDKECNTEEMSASSSECATCSGQKAQLQNHNGNQTGAKPFSCSVCGKRFTQKNNLKEHMKLHSEEKIFSCTVCKKMFHRKMYLNTHMRIHTGEKPFSCSVCGKGFTTGSNLTSHSRVHTGEKPFACSFCEASYSHKVSLLSHLRTHTGEKPFSCSLCDKTFSHRASLNCHLAVHTGEKPFSCSVCGKSFRDKANLRRHLNGHTIETI